MSEARPSSSESYFPSLDGLRTLAFLAVFAFHAQPGAAVLPLVQKVCSWGWSGVNLFFVLSGYLITFLLLKEKKTFGAFSLKNFYARRILRIWPLYYLVLAALAVYPLTMAHWGDLHIYHRFVRKVILPYSLFAGNYGWQQQFQTLRAFCALWSIPFFRYLTLIGPLWSLCVEEQFYLVWPLVLSRINGRAALGWTLSAIVGASIACRYVFWLWSLKPGMDYAVYYLSTPSHADGLMFGAALAAAEISHPGWARRVVAGKTGAFALLAVAATLSAIALWAPDLMARHWTIVPIMTIISAAYAVLLLLSLNWTPLRSLLCAPVLVSTGRITYAMYVFHFCMVDLGGWVADPITAWIAEQMRAFIVISAKQQGQLHWGVHVVVSLVLTYAVAQISWHLLEKRVLAWRRHFRRQIEIQVETTPAVAPQEFAAVR